MKEIILGAGALIVLVITLICYKLNNTESKGLNNPKMIKVRRG